MRRLVPRCYEPSFARLHEPGAHAYIDIFHYFAATDRSFRIPSTAVIAVSSSSSLL